MNITANAKRHTRKFLTVSTQAYREITSSIRRLPDFLIIGAQRSGTTSLFYYLCEHPNIIPGATKEVHFFDDRKDAFAKGMRWYRAQFPTNIHTYWSKPLRQYGFLTGEATPTYLFYPQAPKRISHALPHAKLIILLRNPIDRAYSQYWFRTTLNSEMRLDETWSFEQVIQAEQERIQSKHEKPDMKAHPYDTFYSDAHFLKRGMYAEQLQRWMEVYPREQFLILKSEDLYSNPSTIVEQTLAFLGAPNPAFSQQKEYKQYRIPSKKGYRYKQKSPPMNPETRKYLVDFFRPYNAQLYALLGRDLGWDQ